VTTPAGRAAPPSPDRWGRTRVTGRGAPMARRRSRHVGGRPPPRW
jgi:hypothetical protein